MDKYRGPRPVRKRAIRRRAAAAVLLLVLLDAALFVLLPVRLLHPSAPVVPARPLPVAAVLFHGFGEGESGLSRESLRRLHHGMSLLHGGQAGLLLVAGGNRPDPGRNGARLMAAYLRRHHIPAERILVEDSSRDTASNLAAINRMVAECGLEPAALVSSPHHLLRIRSLGLPGAERLTLLPYPAPSCSPPLTRGEIWFSAHSNFAAWASSVIMPARTYRGMVEWVRANTDF